MDMYTDIQSFISLLFKLAREDRPHIHLFECDYETNQCYYVRMKLLLKCADDVKVAK